MQNFKRILSPTYGKRTLKNTSRVPANGRNVCWKVNYFDEGEGEGEFIIQDKSEENA